MRWLSASYFARPVRHARRATRFALTSSFSFVLAFGALFMSAPRAEAAVTASIVAGTLQVTGDNLSNTITTRVVAGDPTRLEVLDLTTVIGTFSRVGLPGILVDSLGGEDGIYINRINGEITERAVLYGGDGNDLLDGNDGTDTLEMYGTDAAEVFAVNANGTRVSIPRDIGNVLLDLRSSSWRE